jgi:small subunit ribosomal protein S8e
MKRKFELGRQAANTKLGAKRIHSIRVRGGNTKHRALRLDTGNFSWGSEAISRKTRVVAVVYNASNNELVRTNTLVKGAIIQIDATPFRQWYENHYCKTLATKKARKGEEVATEEEKTIEGSARIVKKLTARREAATIAANLEDQFAAGRLYGTFKT